MNERPTVESGAPIQATLTAERKRQGLSMRAVARIADVSPSIVHDWERGVKCPSLDNATVWAEALGYRLIAVPCMSRTDAAAGRVSCGALPPYSVTHIRPETVGGGTEQWFVMGTIGGDPRDQCGPVAICEYEPSAHVIAALLNASGGSVTPPEKGSV